MPIDESIRRDFPAMITDLLIDRSARERGLYHHAGFEERPTRYGDGTGNNGQQLWLQVNFEIGARDMEAI